MIFFSSFLMGSFAQGRIIPMYLLQDEEKKNVMMKIIPKFTLMQKIDSNNREKKIIAMFRNYSNYQDKLYF